MYGCLHNLDGLQDKILDFSQQVPTPHCWLASRETSRLEQCNGPSHVLVANFILCILSSRDSHLPFSTHTSDTLDNGVTLAACTAHIFDSTWEHHPACSTGGVPGGHVHVSSIHTSVIRAEYNVWSATCCYCQITAIHALLPWQLSTFCCKPKQLFCYTRQPATIAILYGALTNTTPFS